MYFDFDDRHIDTPTVDSVMSWREQVLVSLFTHLLVVALVLLVPRLAFVREAEERRAERLAELAEMQAAARRQADDNRTFVFIEPRVDLEAQEAPRPDAPLSDRDRIAQSPLIAEDPLNSLPNADGNSSTFVEADDPLDALDEPELTGVLAEKLEPDPSEVSDPPLDDPADAAADASESADRPGEGLTPDQVIAQALADGALALPGDGREDPDVPNTDADLPADGLLGSAIQNLERYVRQESFSNNRGDAGQIAPWIEFDAKGADFGPWIRRFVAQIRRNWFVPYAVMSRSMHGHVVLTFYVHRDGSISELSILQPSEIQSFTNSAFNALSTSNPTQPLPPEYPDDRAFFTVTFYFNESPPA